MKSWRGVPVLVSLLSGLVVACGPVPEGEAEAVDGRVLVPESETAVGGVTAEGLLPLPGPGWDVCEDSAQRVRDINPQGSSSPVELVEVNGLLLFVATDAEHGRELWMSEGPGRSTSLVKDVNPGVGHSVPRALTVMGPWVFFVADDGVHGVELWRTDGTERGTVLVTDVRPGSTGSLPERLTVVDGTLYFTANDGEHGRELWRSDGTARGTVLAYEFAPGMRAAEFDRLLAWEKELALVVYDGTTRATTLWKVDKRGRVGALFTLADGVFLELEPVGRQLFFTVNPGTDEADLWVTRNAPDTATWLRHFPGQEPKSLTAMGDAVYFAAGGEGYWGDVGDPWHGSELWTSDGTVWGTRLVRDIKPGAEGAFSPFLDPGFVVVDRTLYFAADDGWFGRELWRSDGTLLGTWMVTDLEPGHAGSDPQDLAADTGWLFFSATTSEHGSEPWYSGGRFWNTRSLMDIAPGSASSNPKGFVRAGWNIFFAATDGAGDQELWSLSFRPVRSCGKPAF
jgi:ELWxxDGT repeat protein